MGLPTRVDDGAWPPTPTTSRPPPSTPSSAAARQIRGDLPVVVTSAWTGRLAEAAAALGGVRALPKPARPEEITAVFEAALGDPMDSAERARRRRVWHAAR